MVCPYPTRRPAGQLLFQRKFTTLMDTRRNGGMAAEHLGLGPFVSGEISSAIGIWDSCDRAPRGLVGTRIPETSVGIAPATTAYRCQG